MWSKIKHQDGSEGMVVHKRTSEHSETLTITLIGSKWRIVRWFKIVKARIVWSIKNLFSK